MLVDIHNLSKTFKNGQSDLTILEKLDLQLKKAQKVSIIGSSGSGKSTLLNIMAGIQCPTCGKININGIDIAQATEKQLCFYRTNILGLVFQFHYLLNDFTALENVYISALIKGTPKKQAIQKAKSLLCDVGLKDRLEHLPCELSGGERQRVAVARSLINDPSLILADEPTGNLDPENAVVIAKLLFSLCDKYKTTLVVVTHDKNIAKMADTIFELKKKRLFSVSKLDL